MAFKPVNKVIKNNLLYGFRYSEIRTCPDCPFYLHRQCGMNEYESVCKLGTKMDDTGLIPSDCDLMIDEGN